MNLREVVFKKCAECGRELPEKDIMPSGLCTGCSLKLIEIFLLTPDKITEKIRAHQRREHNDPCFGTGKKETCVWRKDCEWQSICDVEVKAKAGKEVV